MDLLWIFKIVMVAVHRKVVGAVAAVVVYMYAAVTGKGKVMKSVKV